MTLVVCVNAIMHFILKLCLVSSPLCVKGFIQRVSRQLCWVCFVCASVCVVGARSHRALPCLAPAVCGDESDQPADANGLSVGDTQQTRYTVTHNRRWT